MTCSEACFSMMSMNFIVIFHESLHCQMQHLLQLSLDFAIEGPNLVKHSLCSVSCACTLL